jgi:hypothetical protein
MIETATAYTPVSNFQTYDKVIEDLQKSLTNALDTNSSFTRIINEKQSMIDNARLAILEAFGSESFDRENFEIVADALNISMTKEYDVTINVTFSGTVTVPLGFDVEGDLENYINFEANESGWGSVEVETDLFTDGVDVSIYKR